MFGIDVLFRTTSDSPNIYPYSFALQHHHHPPKHRQTIFQHGSCICKIILSIKNTVQTNWMAGHHHPLFCFILFISKCFCACFCSLDLVLYHFAPFILVVYSIWQSFGVFFCFYSVQPRKPSYNVSILIFAHSTSTQTGISRSPSREAASALVDAMPHSASNHIWAPGLRADKSVGFQFVSPSPSLTLPGHSSWGYSK